MRKSLVKNFVFFLLIDIFGYAQEAQWSLKLQSNVYLRTWKLTTKAEKTETEIFGAKVVLYESSTNKPVAQTVTDNEGKFVIDVPANGLYYILVSYPGCNTKKMTVDTRNVPEKFQKDNFKPKFTITGGFIMAKPYPGINYSSLSESLVHVQFMEGKKAFDDDKNFTERGVGICTKIYDAEWDLFMKFCDFNKKGDEALAIPDCPLAKKMYESALALIPGEFYPTQQLAKIPDCLAKNENKKKEEEQKKLKEEQEKLAKQKEAEEKAKREAEEKARKEAEKAEKERLAKEKEEQEKLARQKEAEERAKREAEEKARKEAEKAEKERLAKEKEEQEKLAKQKESEEKAKREAEEKAKKEAEKAEKERLAKEKAEQEKLAKQKEAEEKAKREAEEKAKKEAEKAEKERLAKEKAEQEKLAKQKEAEEKKKKMAEEEERKKAEKERLAKEKEETEKAKREVESKTVQKNIENVQGETNEDPGPQKGKGKATTYQILGSQENYRKNLSRANDLFKTKRYEEAKTAYEECLKFKPDDPLSKLRIRQCDSILQLKK